MTNTTASKRLDIHLTPEDRNVLDTLRASLASPHLPKPPTAAAVIRAALGCFRERLGAMGTGGKV